jgi:NAD-reducing hydrogenase large subunit
MVDRAQRLMADRAQRVVLELGIDTAGAGVRVRRNAAGAAIDARLDLAALPRIEPLLLGRPVAEVPSLVERLCGVCPVPHHLAGVQALEAMAGLRPGSLPATADTARRLLHHAAVVETLAVPFVGTARPAVLAARAWAKAAKAAVGSPGHFPTTAVPGGVIDAVPSAAAWAEAAALAPAALQAAEELVAAATGAPPDPAQPAWAGADAALVDALGHPDPLGGWLKVVAADGSVLAEGATPDQFADLVALAAPTDAAPRPYLRALGPAAERYRVGPVAILRTGTLDTPRAAAHQGAWLAAGPAALAGGAATARAIFLLHCLERAAAILAAPAPTARSQHRLPHLNPKEGWGVGWVDGPRGLLVHRYEAEGAPPALTNATILTPTAQNEPWLADLLTDAIGQPDPTRQQALEAALRAADPCLPFLAAPPGTMDIAILEEVQP